MIFITEGQTAVTTFTADEAVVWSLAAGPDAAIFDIDATSGALRFVQIPAYAAPQDADGDNTYLVTVSARDASGNSSAQTVRITLTALPNPDQTPPVISGPPYAAVVVTEAQSAVASFMADEPVAWGISGPDAAKLQIDTFGVVSFLIAPDHAAPGDANGDNVYQIRVTATDTAGNIAQQDLGITVIAVVAADVTPPVVSGPSGSAPAQTILVQEGQSAVTTVTTITADEPVNWGVGGADAAVFTFDPLTGALRFVVAPDHNAPADADGDNTYLLRISASDLAGNLTALTLTITVTALVAIDVTPPILTGPTGGDAAQTASVPEGQIAVAAFTADEVVQWAVTGSDAAAFVIDPATGVLRFVTAPYTTPPGDADGNNIYRITITATDGGGNVTAIALAVTVTAVRLPDVTPPLITGPSGNPGAARASITGPERRLVVTRLRADRLVIWSVSGGVDAAMFAVDAMTGTVTFVTPPDFDRPGDANGDNVYSVEISAGDVLGNTSIQILSVTISDVVEPDITAPGIFGPTEQTIRLPEGQIAVVRLQADEAVIWSISGGRDLTALIIDPASGAVRFATAPDFDAPADADGDNSYGVVVTATDAAGNTSRVILTAVVLDIDATIAEVFDIYDQDVMQIVEDIEVKQLQSSIASFQDMAAAALDRFIAAKQLRKSCAAPDDLAHQVMLMDCSNIASRNNVPFSVHGQLQLGTRGAFTTGTFFGQTGNFSGTQRRVISGDFSFVNTGVGITTIDLTGRIAWERLIFDRVMLGSFVGGSIAQTDINRRLTGRSNKISLSLGTYFVAELQPDLYLDGFLSVAASRNMLVLQTADIHLDGQYTARSLLMGLALSGVIARDGYDLRPEIALGYGATTIGPVRFDATVDDQGQAVTAIVNGVDFATLRLTPELRIPVYAGSDAAHYIIAPSLVCDWANGQPDCGGGLRFGLQGSSRDRRTRFNIMADIDRIKGNTRVALRANVDFQF